EPSHYLVGVLSKRSESTRFAVMRLKVFSVTAIFILLVCSLFAAPKAKDSTDSQIGQRDGGRSTIFGRAVFHDTNRPVGHSRIVLRGLDSFGPEQIDGTTNSGGEF